MTRAAHQMILAAHQMICAAHQISFGWSN
jgi:hypothetical protein